MTQHHEEEAIDKAYDAHLMRRLLRYLSPYKLQVLSSMLIIGVASLLQVSSPYLTKIGIDNYIVHGDLAGLNKVVLVYLAIILFGFLLGYLQTYIMQLTGQRIMFDLRLEIFTHLQNLPLSFFDKNPVGRLMTRVTTDVDVLNELFTAGVVTLLGDVLVLLGIVAILFVLNAKLALVAFSVIPLLFSDHHCLQDQGQRLLSPRADGHCSHQCLPAGADQRHVHCSALQPRTKEFSAI